MKKNKPLLFGQANQLDTLENRIRQFVKTAAVEEPLFPASMERADRAELNFIVEAGKARVFLHSIYDVQREMKEIFQGVDRETEVLILFGLGLGHALEYAANILPKLEQVFLVEPSGSMLTTLLRQTEVVQCLGKVPSVTFIWNKSAEQVAGELSAQIDQQVRKKYAVAFHMAYRSLFRDYFETATNRIVAHLRQAQVQNATAHGNIYYRTQNTLNNLRARSVDIQRFLDAIRGVPAIMVSAGPSLNRNIHLLEAAKRKALVIPVGSAVKILHNKGIKPHIRAAFSPYPDENVVFDGIPDFEGIPLVYSNTLDYLVVQKYNAPKSRMVMVSDLISRYFYALSGYRHTLVEGGGTIANVTFDLLCRAGCSQVIFAGQDLSLSGLKLYADGSWSDPSFSGQEGGLIKEKDIYGEDIFTTKAFLGIRESFEQAARHHAQVNIVNATEGGLPLAGVRNMTLERVLEELPERPDLEDVLRSAFSEEAETEEATGKLEVALEKAEKEVSQLMDANDRWFGAIQDLKVKGRSVHRVLADLGDIQNQHEAELQTIPLYGELIRHEIATNLAVIRKAYQYDGADNEQKVNNLAESIAGQMKKIHEYAKFFQDALQRSKGG